MAALARSEMVAARASLCEEVMRRAKGTRSRTVLNPSAQQEVRLRGWGRAAAEQRENAGKQESRRHALAAEAKQRPAEDVARGVAESGPEL
jgi:hypothetical protein